MTGSIHDDILLELAKLRGRALGEQDCDINSFNCGLIGDGGAWGAALLAFLASDCVTEIYRTHGLARLE